MNMILFKILFYFLCLNQQVQFLITVISSLEINISLQKTFQNKLESLLIPTFNQSEIIAKAVTK